jgi:hypothetical protein
MQQGLVTHVQSAVPTAEIAVRTAPSKWLARTLRESLAITAWLYVIAKLFVYDVDVHFFRAYLPGFTWILDFKFFVLLGCAAFSVAIFKSKNILIWISFILAYPLILLCWRIPCFVLRQKSWILALALIDGVISFFRSLKYKLIAFSIYSISVVAILASTSPILLSAAIGILISILLLTLIRRLIAVFKPTAIFYFYKKFISIARERIFESVRLDEPLREVPVDRLNQDQLKKWVSGLQTSVLLNRACLFSARKLSQYQNSGMNIISGIFVVLILVISITLTFAVINFGLYKIDPSFYRVAPRLTFFTFVYYSFNALVFSGIEEIVPTAIASQLASMLERFFGLFLTAIFAALMVSVRTERHADELKNVIVGLESEGRSLERLIRTDYKLNSIEEAMSELERLKADAIKLVLFLSNAL